MIFHNIFKSKNPEKAKSAGIKIKPRIIADIHEKNSLVISTLCEIGCDVETTSLKIGDYLIGDTLVERKTFNDFISSMVSGRMAAQLQQLKQSKKALLLIEGLDLNSEFLGKIQPNSIRGFLLSIELNHGIPIILAENSEETAIYLSLLAKQQLKNPRPVSLHSRIPKTPKEQKQYILESFPNIGPKTAEKLLKEFKTLANIFNSEEKNLEKILKGKTAEFKRILGSEN